jgi:hypothetical protein
MKTFKIYLLLAALLSANNFANAQQSFIARPAPTSISKALDQIHVLHSINSWQIKQIDTENNYKIVIEAIEYLAVNPSTNLKGLKIVLLNKKTEEGDFFSRAMTQISTYIEDNEYAEILIALDNMIKGYQDKKAKKEYGEMSYLTKGGVRIGYSLNPIKPIAYLAIKTGEIEISAESNSPEGFLKDIKDQFDIANKELYLPENLLKLKNAKKSNTKDAKDVNIEDL